MADQPPSTLPSPKRRWLMKTAVVIGAAGAALGGSVFWHRGMADGKLTEYGADVLRGLARGVLSDILPKEPAQRQAALDAHVRRMDAFLNNLPHSLRNEINALLGLLANPPTRYLVAGLGQSWSSASDAEITRALEYMRLNALPTTQMAYHAVRDITCVMFFTAPENWSLVGYPGPMNV
ncbi:MAG TPA: hypothetical protein VFM33_03980 [Aquabacterium sp.]|nr:hypothetical protein [Aquabacterium sp.]